MNPLLLPQTLPDEMEDWIEETYEQIYEQYSHAGTELKGGLPIAKALEEAYRKGWDDGTNCVWHPIDTAPRDGTRVLAWRAGWEESRFVRWIFNRRTQTEFWNDAEELDDYELEQEPPTHWFPLPDLPDA
jgi:hypothetical protein